MAPKAGTKRRAATAAAAASDAPVAKRLRSASARSEERKAAPSRAPVRAARSGAAAVTTAGAAGAGHAHAVAPTAARAVHTISEDNYYGQRDNRGVPHGMGVRLTVDGQIIGQKCGRWEYGALVKVQWVWRGFLPDDAPLSDWARAATALAYHGGYYFGATSGPQYLPNGKGRTYSATRELRSDGCFVDGVQVGAGVYHCDNGAVYTGHFVNNRFEGSGSMRYANESCYEGGWKGGFKYGIGRFTCERANSVYEGQWIDGRQEGFGIEWSKNKPATVLQCGLWYQGKLTQSRPIARSALPADSRYLSTAMCAAGPGVLLLPAGGY